MPLRQFTSGSGYRYGFNGQEQSKELNGDGNSYTAEFWQYDARLGRRWNVDPRPSTSISPFATFNNNPILYSDALGDTSVVGAGGVLNIEIDNKANTLEFYQSSNNVIKGTQTKTPSQSGQLRSFSNILGTFTARWATDANGAAVFAGYLNDKGRSVDQEIEHINKLTERLNSPTNQGLLALYRFRPQNWGNLALQWTEELNQSYINDPVGTNLKIGFTLATMSIMADAEAGAFQSGRGYNPTRTTLDDMSGIGFIESAPKFADGTFSIFKWHGYPMGSPRPTGTFRLLEGPEYQQARELANKTNAKIHKNNSYLKGLQIHELVPVKFGGSPTSSSNKIYLTPAQHSQYTNFWNSIMRNIQTLK